jgi:IPT/TIG domain.
MKNKYLLTVKCVLASVILGFFGIMSVSTSVSAASNDVVLSVTVQQVAFDLNVISPAPNDQIGDSFSVYINGDNISIVDVYIDLNSDGNYEASELLGTFTINEAGIFDRLIGPVSVPNGTPEGLYNMQVVGHQMNGGSDFISKIIPVKYTSSAPRIDKIEPNFGPTDGGTEIIIYGQNFKDGSEVYIGSEKCLNINVVSPTEIRCITPPGAEGSASVTIIGSNGTSTDSYGFLYKKYNKGSGGDIQLPNTGLFRVGDKVVMSSDVIIIVLSLFIIILLLLSILLLNKNKENQKLIKKSKKQSTKKSTPRVRSKK